MYMVVGKDYLSTSTITSSRMNSLIDQSMDYVHDQYFASSGSTCEMVCVDAGKHAKQGKAHRVKIRD